MAIHHSAFIHPKAHVEADKVSIGAGSKVFQFGSVTRGSKLGEDCVVWPFAMIDGAQIGDRCKIASGVVMGAGFKLGDDVFVGPNVTFANDMWPEANPEGFDDAALREGGKFVIVVENGVSIGAGAVILPGTYLRTGCLIAAGAVVQGVVPENMVHRKTGYQGAIPPGRRRMRMHYVREDAGR